MARPETEFPPVIVFDDGQDCWLADGFHRLAAARAQLADIACEVRPGSLREAILSAVGANSSHGLRRSNEDKRRAVRLMLADALYAQWLGMREKTIAVEEIHLYEMSIDNAMDRLWVACRDLKDSSGQPLPPADRAMICRRFSRHTAAEIS